MGPLLRSMYIKENQGLKFQFLLGDTKNCLGSSVSFWADLKAWEQMPKASPSPILSFRPTVMFFQQKSQNCFDANFSVPD